MTNNRGQEVFTLEGTVLRKFPVEYGSKNGRKWAKNKFILKTLDNRDLYITTFGKFSEQLIGKDIRFQATQYNETNYTVQGEVEEAGDLVGAAVAATEPAVTQETSAAVATTKRRGRPSKAAVAPTTASVAVHTPLPESNAPVAVDDTREGLRAQAEASTLKDLESAVRLAAHLGLDTKDTEGIVALADRVGRTITAIGLDNRNKR